MSTLSTSVALEDQVKTFTFTYADFCLLIAVVAQHASCELDISGEWRRLYLRLGGEA